MPIGDFINQIPAPAFMFIHLSAFAIGAYFAWRSFGGGMPLLGWAFTLFAAAEISEGEGAGRQSAPQQRWKVLHVEVHRRLGVTLAHASEVTRRQAGSRRSRPRSTRS